MYDFLICLFDGMYYICILTKQIMDFQLNIDNQGCPYITFKHYENVDSLKQNLVGLFVKMAKENGIVLRNPQGHIEMGESWEKYEIAIKK